MEYSNDDQEGKDSGQISFPCSPPIDADHHNRYPWLMVSQGRNEERHTFYSISEDQNIDRIIPDFDNMEVFSASYGWLILLDLDTLDSYLVNDFSESSQHKILLPQGISHTHYTCTLSKPPADPNCHVLLVASDHILFCRLGDHDEEFVKRDNDFEEDGDLRIVTNFNGNIYGWMKDGKFVTLDFVGQELRVRHLMNDKNEPCLIPWPSPSYAPCFSYSMVEACGELLLVHMVCSPHTGKPSYFRIFNIDVVENTWEELKSIGKRTIFLSPSGCMSLPSTATGGVS